MSDVPILPNMYASVILVDRAMTGATEFLYDGVPIVFPAGRIEMPVPQGIAEHLFVTQKERVPLTGGGFAMRFGIKDPNPELLAMLGEECGNCDPIEIDHGRLEGWDVENHVQRPGARKVLKVNRDPSDYQNLATGSASYGQER